MNSSCNILKDHGENNRLNTKAFGGQRLSDFWPKDGVVQNVAGTPLNASNGINVGIYDDKLWTETHKRNMQEMGTLVNPYTGEESKLFVNALNPPTHDYTLSKDETSRPHPMIAALTGNVHERDARPKRMEVAAPSAPWNAGRAPPGVSEQIIASGVRSQLNERVSRDLFFNRNGDRVDGSVLPMPENGEAFGYVGYQPTLRYVPWMPATNVIDVSDWRAGVALENGAYTNKHDVFETNKRQIQTNVRKPIGGVDNTQYVDRLVNNISINGSNMKIPLTQGSLNGGGSNSTKGNGWISRPKQIPVLNTRIGMSSSSVGGSYMPVAELPKKTLRDVDNGKSRPYTSSMFEVGSVVQPINKSKIHKLRGKKLMNVNNGVELTDTKAPVFCTKPARIPLRAMNERRLPLKTAVSDIPDIGSYNRDNIVKTSHVLRGRIGASDILSNSKVSDGIGVGNVQWSEMAKTWLKALPPEYQTVRNQPMDADLSSITRERMLPISA